MKQLFILFAAVCGCMVAQAQKIDDGKFVKGGLKFEVTSLDPKTVKVIANDYLGLSFTIPATVSYLEDDYAVTAIGENAFAGVGSQSNPAVLLLPADWKGTKPEATATLWYGGYFVDYRATTIADIKAESNKAENSIAEAATDFVEIEDVKQAKANAASNLEDAKATANNTISAAVDMIAIKNAKDYAIGVIHMTTSKAVEDIQTAIKEFIALQQNTIKEVEQVAATAKEEIDGLGVDDNAKSDAKAQIGNIVNTAKAAINEATNKDMINKAKTQAIADINNVVQATKDMWVTVRTDGVVGNWNTICLERNITAIDGATFWTVSGQDANSFVLDAVTEPKAGQGYLIRFTATELKVKYGDQKVTEPVTATYDNPIQGTFTQIDFDQDGKNVLVGNYVVYNNQLCPVKAWVGMRGHRAYVVADLVPNTVPRQAPSCARAYMPKPDQTPTELESVDDSQRTIRNGKFLRNGQLIIVKDNKMYNVQGMKL